MLRGYERWIPLATAAEIAGCKIWTLRRRLQKLNADSSVPIIRKWGSHGRWHVDASAFGQYMRDQSDIATLLYSVVDRLDLVEMRVDGLRDQVIDSERPAS